VYGVGEGIVGKHFIGASRKMSKNDKWAMAATLSVLLLGASVCRAGDALPPTSHPDSSHWRDLFAPDLSNTVYLKLGAKLSSILSDKGTWAFHDGILDADGDQTILTKEQYADYILDLEFKNDPGANSGVFIYCSDLKNWVPNKLEIQILDDYAACWATQPDTTHCGAVYRRLAPSKQVVKKAGEWNRMTLWCLGTKVYEMLNGELVLQLDMSQWTSGQKTPDGRDIPRIYNKPLADLPTKGHIGLQGNHGKGHVCYRNVKIQFLTSTRSRGVKHGE